MRIKWGNYITKETLQDGTEVETKETYREGRMIQKQIRYEIRKKVSNDKEELAEWLKFKQEHKDAGILEIRTEKKPWLGTEYFIVLSWEELTSKNN